MCACVSVCPCRGLCCSHCGTKTGFNQNETQNKQTTKRVAMSGRRAWRSRPTARSTRMNVMHGQSDRSVSSSTDGPSLCSFTLCSYCRCAQALCRSGDVLNASTEELLDAMEAGLAGPHWKLIHGVRWWSSKTDWPSESDCSSCGQTRITEQPVAFSR